MSGRSLPRTTFFTGVSKGIEGVGSLIATLIVARYLGPAGYGVYAQVISSVMLLWPLVDMGLDHVIVRELVAGGDREAVVGSGLVLRFAAGLLCSVVLMGWVLMGGETEIVAATGLAIVNILLVRQVSNLVCRAFFLGIERVENDALATTVGQAARIGGLVVAARLDLGLLGVLAIPIGAEVLQTIVGILLARRFISLIQIRAAFSTARSLAQQSWSILLRLLLVTAYFHIDNVLLAGMLSTEDLGLFAAPFRLVTGLVMVVVPTVWALLPSLVRGAGSSDSAKITNRVGPLAAASTALLGAAFVLGSSPLVSLTFGEGSRLESAARCLRLLALLPVLHTVAYIMELELLAVGRQQWALLGAGPALALKIVGDIALADAFGPLTGAVTSVAADVVRVILLAWVARSRWMVNALVPIGLLGLLVLGSLLPGVIP